MNKELITKKPKWIIDEYDLVDPFTHKPTFELNNIKNFNVFETSNVLSFTRYADRVSEDNTDITIMMYYVFLSQFFNKNFYYTIGGGNPQSLRFSALFIQPSRTGKNYATDIIQKLSEISLKKYSQQDGGIKLSKLSSYTELGIIGRVNEYAIRYNEALEMKGIMSDTFEKELKDLEEKYNIENLNKQEKKELKDLEEKYNNMFKELKNKEIDESKTINKLNKEKLKIINKYNELKKDNTKYEKEFNKIIKHKYKDTWNKGLMEISNIILFEEAKSLFVGSNKEQLTMYMQEMLDEKGEIVYKTGSSKEYIRKTTCSLLMTSIPFDKKDIEKVIENGFFQRFLINNKTFTNEEIRRFEKNKFDKQMNYDKSDIVYDYKWGEAILNEIIDDLYIIKNKHLSGNNEFKKEIKFSKSSLKMIDDLVRKQSEDVKKNMFGKTVSFIPSFENVIRQCYYKISVISRILRRYSNTNKENEFVNEKDVKCATKIVKNHLSSMISLIGNLYNKENLEKIKYSILIGNRFVIEDEIVDKFYRKLKIDKNNAQILLNGLIDENFLDIKYNDVYGKNMYKCRDLIWNYKLTDKDYNEKKLNKNKCLKLISKNVHFKYLILLIKIYKEKFENNLKININELNNFINVFPSLKKDNNVMTKLLDNKIFYKKNEYFNFHYETNEVKNTIKESTTLMLNLINLYQWNKKIYNLKIKLKQEYEGEPNSFYEEKVKESDEYNDKPKIYKKTQELFDYVK